MDHISRKNFLRMSALGFGALIVPNSLFAYEGREPFAKKVRVGLIGVGMRRDGERLLSKRCHGDFKYGSKRNVRRIDSRTGRIFA